MPFTAVTDPIPTPAHELFQIGENEPLVWLVSLLFTKQFQNRKNLGEDFVFPSFNPNAKPKPSDEPIYDSLPSLYSAAHQFVMEDARAMECYFSAQDSIRIGELAYYEPPANEWGDRPPYKPKRDVNTYEFLIWAKESNWGVPKDVLASCETLIHLGVSRKQNEERIAAEYPRITEASFERLRKEPLWRIGSAIMYVMGHRSAVDVREQYFKGYNNLFERMHRYVLDGDKAGQIKVIGYDRSYKLDDKRKPFDVYMLNAKIKPEEFIAWAKTLPVDLPMLKNSTPPVALTATPPAAPLPALHTPEMQLMFAAMEHFGLANPSNPAPLKKLVTGWLKENAPNFGIELSDNLANAMDTIMRPADARSGGLKQVKP